jgi:autotransporter-associated beta strand protein
MASRASPEAAERLGLRLDRVAGGEWFGTLTLTGNNTYTGGTSINGGILSISSDGNLGGAAGGLTLAGGTLQTTATMASARTITLGGGNGTFSPDSGTTLTLGGSIGGAGGLIKAGGGTLALTGDSNYSGGTILNAGGLAVSGSLASAVTVNDGNLLVSGNVTGGVVQNAGSTLLTGTVAGGFTMNAGTAVLNGTVTGTVTANGGMLGGSGTIGGLNVVGGIVGPGNSIGTLNIAGIFAQSGGVYQVEVDAAGQSDRIVATGTATINGGTVQVLAQTGTYATSTTYTILTAAGGRTGTYSGVSSNFAFLTPSLSYDANNVFLTLALQGNAFSGFGGNTPNQRAVGYALDQSYANATGDFATVVSALANLSTMQASPALDAISGQQYADFGTTNVNTSAMFMNTLGQQMALARSGAGSGRRVALAMACEVEACDTARPLSAWFSGLGGLGSVQGDSNASTLTYNFGGAAAGIDYRLSPQFLVGLGVGYTHRTQWVNSFMGQGWSDSVSVAAYGSFSQGGFYADALAGYAYFNNQMQRQIQIPGLQPRTATGSTGANQFLTQVETGYGLPVFGEKLTPHRSPACSSRPRRRMDSANREPTLSAWTWRSRRPTRCARCSAPSWRALFLLAATGNWAWRCGWAGSTSMPTPAGRSPRPSPGHPVPRSPSTAPRRRAMPRSSASRPTPRWPNQRSSTCATTARSRPAPTTTPSPPVCG